jgi:cell division protein FtsI (penicillin-binding protein 3)
MAMVMEPSTGKILAMADVPGFNPNIPQAYSSDQRANKCISCNYEPGSTFKLITAAAALEQKVKKESDTIDGNMGSFEIYNEKIRDHKPYGKLSFAQAIAYSSNVCFAKIANDLGNDRLYSYTLNFGLGARTGIALPGEEAGIVNPVSKWSGRTRVTMAMGQEVSATFLQMMLAYAAIANNGLLVEPRIYERVVSSTGAVLDTSKARTVRRIVSRDVARRLRVLLTGVVEYGTGVNAALKNVAVAGKTGTSQKLNKETGTYSDFLSYASFIGFVPADNPVLVAGIVIDEPANAEYGGTAAAPAFKQIITQIISNPYLEYAEQILHEKPVMPDTSEQKAVTVPLICGMTRSQAEHLLKDTRIKFEVFGAGDTVTGQSPDAGETVKAGSTIIVYAHHKGNLETAGTRSVVPDCRGKDLHDALNILNIKGIIPYVSGVGTVRSQNPGVGSLIRHTDVCTLFCSFDG